MSWARLDDGFHDHPKVGGLTLAAVGLWTLCFTWANRHLGADELQPGFIPKHQPKRFGGTARHVKELVDADLWHPVDGGWIIHDFEDYLPPTRSPETASSISQKRSEAGRKGAAARWQDHGKPDGNLPSPLPSDAWQTDSKPLARPNAVPMPPTRPVPEPLVGGSRRSVTTRPDPWCPRHPGGTDQPCGACGIARRAHDTWQPPTPVPPTLAERHAELARLTQETA